MKTKKPWIDPNNLNNVQKLLIALGIFALIAVSLLFMVEPQPIQAQNVTPTLEGHNYGETDMDCNVTITTSWSPVAWQENDR